MVSRPKGARALVSVAALGALCAFGAGGAAAGGVSQTASASACPSTRNCQPPKWYRFKIGGTTRYRYGGTETWSMRGKLRRMRSNAIQAEYWQHSGTVTLTFRDIGAELDASDCGGEGGFGYFNAPTQTIRLRRNDEDVFFKFWISGGKPEYWMSTGSSTDDSRGAHGTWTCPNGSRFPGLEAHKWTGIWTERGLPRRVVKGSGSYLSRDLERYRFHWKLTALTAGG